MVAEKGCNDWPDRSRVSPLGITFGHWIHSFVCKVGYFDARNIDTLLYKFGVWLTWPLWENVTNGLYGTNLWNNLQSSSFESNPHHHLQDEFLHNLNIVHILTYKSLYSPIINKNYICSFNRGKLMGWSHQTFHPVPTMKLLGTMFRIRYWPTIFHNITVRFVDTWCHKWMVWLVLMNNLGQWTLIHIGVNIEVMVCLILFFCIVFFLDYQKEQFMNFFNICSYVLIVFALSTYILIILAL